MTSLHVPDSLLGESLRVRERMTSYFDGGSENWPASPEFFGAKIVFPIAADVMITERFSLAPGRDASGQPSTVSPHRDCFG